MPRPAGKRVEQPAQTAARWTDTAASDLEGIVDYLAETSPDTAAEVARRLVAAVDSLSEQPERGRVVPELERIGVTAYRELVRAPWRILYRVDGGAAHVVAVLDGRRNVEDLLLSRLVRGAGTSAPD